VVLLDTVPGTLFLKTLDSNRYLAILVELLEVVPGTAGSMIGWMVLNPVALSASNE